MENVVKRKVFFKNRMKRLFVLTDEWSDKGYWIAKDKGQWLLVQYSFFNQVGVSSNLEGIDRQLTKLKAQGV
tara:strand:+ start:2461 stop:2676 length:216 start_codon:yes stop_codon:yes gene_type:complete